MKTSEVWKSLQIALLPIALIWLILAALVVTPGELSGSVTFLSWKVHRGRSVIMGFHTNPDPAQFDDHEWLHSVYTLDGVTGYALIHDEYHGHLYRASVPPAKSESAGTTP